MEITMAPLQFNPNRLRTSTACFLMSAALLAGPAQADVLNLSPGGTTHVSIQAAVDAANDGDTLLIGPGTYEGFTLARFTSRTATSSLVCHRSPW